MPVAALIKGEFKMKIIAGDQEIIIKDTPRREMATAEGSLHEALRFTVEGELNATQIEALSTYDWQVMDGDTIVEGYSGYNTIAKHEVIFAKVKTKQQEIDDALKPVLEKLDDEMALEFKTLYSEWIIGRVYTVGKRVRYKDILYKCLTEHLSQIDWAPDVSPSLWAEVLVSETGEILEWKQPDSTNPYMSGDKVTHNGKTWESLVDNNVWEPGVVGTEALWSEVTE